MTAASLNASFVAAYKHNQFKTGCMFWQFSSDPNGTIVAQAMSGLISSLNSNSISSPPNSSSSIVYPVKFARVNKVLSFSSLSVAILSLGLPINGVKYNVVSYSAWTYSYGPV